MKCVGGFLIAISVFSLMSFPAAASPHELTAADNPYAGMDPDGVPVNVTAWGNPGTAGKADNRKAGVSPERNSLVIDYEKLQRDRADADPSKDKSSNFYLQLSMNKDLAKLAGVDLIGPDSTKETAPAPKTGSDDGGGKNAPTLRSDPSSAAGRKDFVPLMTSMRAPGTLTSVSTVTPWSSASKLSAPGFLLPSNQPPDVAPVAVVPDHSTAFVEATDLQTPGMVASKDDPAGVADTPDLSLDTLPGETPADARARETANSQPELSQAMDANALHQRQASSLKVPVAVSAAKATPVQLPTTPQPKAVQVNPADAPITVHQEPALNPVRAPNQNPYDILDR